MTTGVDSFDSLVIAAIEVLGNYAERPLVAELLAVEEKTLDDPLTRLVGSGRVRNGEVLELVAPPSALPPDDLTADPSASAGPHAELSSRAAALVRAAGGSATEVADLVLAAEPKSCGRWVIETLEAAARGDSRDGKKGRASAYLLRALEERPRDNERRRLLLALASIESRTNAVGAISHYRSAIELMDAPTEKTSARIRLARCLAGNGQTLEALDELDVAAADDASDQDSLELDVAYVGLARQNIDTRPLGRSRLAEIARNHERSPLEVTSPSARAILAELAYEEVLAGDDNHSVIATAGAALGENLEGIHELPATALHVTLLSLVWAGEVRLVDRAARLIEARAKRRGASLVSVGASQILMMVHWARGDAEATVTAADHALEGASGGLVAFLPATYGTKAQALAALGRIDDARSQLELPAMGVDWSSMASYHGYLIGRARVLLVAGDPAGAEQAARRCGALAQAMGTVNPAVLPWRGIAAEASAALGHLDASRALAEEELTLARRFGAPGPVAAALAALSASATPSEAIPLLEEAVALAAGTPENTGAL